MRSLFKWLWVAVNEIDNHFRSVIDMSRSTKTLKGIQVPGSITFKKLPKGAWRIASSLFKMVVKFSHKNYTSGGENGARTVSVRCERLCKPCTQRCSIFGKFEHLKRKNRKVSNSKRAQYYGNWKRSRKHMAAFRHASREGYGSGFISYDQKINFRRRSWEIVLVWIRISPKGSLFRFVESNKVKPAPFCVN